MSHCQGPLVLYQVSMMESKAGLKPMTKTLTPDICVIGAGSGGLSVAAAAAAFGVSVVLIEKGKMGGDCLNTGCVPSKALLAAAKRAHVYETSQAFGIHTRAPDIDFAKVNAHVHEVIASIAPHDSVERFTGLGVTVIQEAARFEDAQTVIAGEHHIKARRFVVATGSSAGVPPIKGLDSVPFLTNETLFGLTACPEHLIVIGGGPIGMEMAQAHRRLGASVTVLEAFTALGKDDAELTAVVLDQLQSDGITIHEGISIDNISGTKGDIQVAFTADGTRHEVNGSHLLVAAGRIPNVEALDLEAAQIKYERSGIVVNDRLRTTNAKVYAIGDVIGGLQFTHVAGYHAGIVIRNILFRMRAKVNNDIIPWVTYTDPELAHVGLDQERARRRFGAVDVLRWRYADNDRARAERHTQGLIKLITTGRGRIVGASIVGANAGELIAPLGLAVANGMKVGALANMVIAYPTLSEVVRRAAITHYDDKLNNPLVRKTINFLARFG